MSDLHAEYIAYLNAPDRAAIPYSFEGWLAAEVLRLRDTIPAPVYCDLCGFKAVTSLMEGVFHDKFSGVYKGKKWACETCQEDYEGLST